MESEKYLEGQSMQRPPLFESDGFIYWKNRFETYVKSKDLDLWHVITDGDFPPIQNNPETKKDEVVPFHKQNDDLKKKLAKNNEAKMVIYNALPRKEYERIFMCQTAKEIWDTLLITHQVDEDRSCSIVEDEELCYAVTRIPRNSSRDDGRFVRQHEAIRIPFQRVEMMVMVKVKENVLDVVIQITSLVNVQSRQRTTIKEHLLEEHGAIMEKMK
ncbi:hypothetical protein Tco_0679483 [Tanacetum coccineum]|uniref:DUF4219 domain-containing protein n=1 Tax=Tanacetum coccineum TaxID=301880 RepID=A0ABQ4XI83_9ASTR